MTNNYFEELNPQQKTAATSPSRTILCLAGAGSGKTKTLIARIQHLVSQGVDPKTILALTFTNAAAFEMKERYKRLPGVNLNSGSLPEFRTFHGFCYSLIIKDANIRKRLGYTKIPEVCDDNKLKKIKTEIKLQLNCKLTDEQLDNEVYLTRAEKDQKELFQKALVKRMKQDNLITFDMMCYNVCELFVKKYPEIERYRKFYTNILLDEFQDTDKLQFRFVSSFPETVSFWLCGDALQCIYQFRNCTNEFVKQLAVDPNWEVVKLFTNYRSTKQICNFANKFSTYAKDEYRIPIEGLRDGEEPEVIRGSYSSYENPVDEKHLDILVNRLKENKSECAILCRTNRECAAVKSRLNEEGIEFCAQTKSNNAIDLLESALSNDYMLDWLASKLEAADYGDYIRLSAQIENPDIKWFLGFYYNNVKIAKLADTIIAIRNTVSTNDDPKTKFDKIVKLLRVKSKCSFKGDANSSNKEIVEGIRDQLKELADNKCYVGTIHSSKGLEYDTVYVMGVNDKMFELGSEDMNNLYYVAVTRARNHLTVFRR